MGEDYEKDSFQDGEIGDSDTSVDLFRKTGQDQQQHSSSTRMNSGSLTNEAQTFGHGNNFANQQSDTAYQTTLAPGTAAPGASPRPIVSPYHRSKSLDDAVPSLSSIRTPKNRLVLFQQLAPQHLFAPAFAQQRRQTIQSLSYQQLSLSSNLSLSQVDCVYTEESLSRPNQHAKPERMDELLRQNSDSSLESLPAWSSPTSTVDVDIDATETVSVDVVPENSLLAPQLTRVALESGPQRDELEQISREPPQPSEQLLREQQLLHTAPKIQTSSTKNDQLALLQLEDVKQNEDEKEYSESGESLVKNDGCAIDEPVEKKSSVLETTSEHSNSLETNSEERKVGKVVDSSISIIPKSDPSAGIYSTDDVKNGFESSLTEPVGELSAIYSNDRDICDDKNEKSNSLPPSGDDDTTSEDELEDVSFKPPSIHQLNTNQPLSSSDDDDDDESSDEETLEDEHSVTLVDDTGFDEDEEENVLLEEKNDKKVSLNEAAEKSNEPDESLEDLERRSAFVKPRSVETAVEMPKQVTNLEEDDFEMPPLLSPLPSNQFMHSDEEEEEEDETEFTEEDDIVLVQKRKISSFQSQNPQDARDVSISENEKVREMSFPELPSEVKYDMTVAGEVEDDDEDDDDDDDDDDGLSDEEQPTTSYESTSDEDEDDDDEESLVTPKEQQEPQTPEIKVEVLEGDSLPISTQFRRAPGRSQTSDGMPSMPGRRQLEGNPETYCTRQQSEPIIDDDDEMPPLSPFRRRVSVHRARSSDGMPTLSRRRRTIRDEKVVVSKADPLPILQPILRRNFEDQNKPTQASLIKDGASVAGKDPANIPLPSVPPLRRRPLARALSTDGAPGILPMTQCEALVPLTRSVDGMFAVSDNSVKMQSIRNEKEPSDDASATNLLHDQHHRTSTSMTSIKVEETEQLLINTEGTGGLESNTLDPTLMGMRPPTPPRRRSLGRSMSSDFVSRQALSTSYSLPANTLPMNESMPIEHNSLMRNNLIQSTSADGTVSTVVRQNKQKKESDAMKVSLDIAIGDGNCKDNSHKVDDKNINILKKTNVDDSATTQSIENHRHVTRSLSTDSIPRMPVRQSQLDQTRPAELNVHQVSLQAHPSLEKVRHEQQEIVVTKPQQRDNERLLTFHSTSSTPHSSSLSEAPNVNIEDDAIRSTNALKIDRSINIRTNNNNEDETERVSNLKHKQLATDKDMIINGFKKEQTKNCGNSLLIPPPMLLRRRAPVRSVSSDGMPIMPARRHGDKRENRRQEHLTSAVDEKQTFRRSVHQRSASTDDVSKPVLASLRGCAPDRQLKNNAHQGASILEKHSNFIPRMQSRQVHQNEESSLEQEPIVDKQQRPSENHDELSSSDEELVENNATSFHQKSLSEESCSVDESSSTSEDFTDDDLEREKISIGQINTTKNGREVSSDEESLDEVITEKPQAGETSSSEDEDDAEEVDDEPVLGPSSFKIHPMIRRTPLRSQSTSVVPALRHTRTYIAQREQRIKQEEANRTAQQIENKVQRAPVTRARSDMPIRRAPPGRSHSGAGMTELGGLVGRVAPNRMHSGAGMMELGAAAGRNAPARMHSGAGMAELAAAMGRNAPSRMHSGTGLSEMGGVVRRIPPARMHSGAGMADLGSVARQSAPDRMHFEAETTETETTFRRSAPTRLLSKSRIELHEEAGTTGFGAVTDRHAPGRMRSGAGMAELGALMNRSVPPRVKSEARLIALGDSTGGIASYRLKSGAEVSSTTSQSDLNWMQPGTKVFDSELSVRSASISGHSSIQTHLGAVFPEVSRLQQEQKLHGTLPQEDLLESPQINIKNSRGSIEQVQPQAQTLTRKAPLRSYSTGYMVTKFSNPLSGKSLECVEDECVRQAEHQDNDCRHSTISLEQRRPLLSRRHSELRPMKTSCPDSSNVSMGRRAPPSRTHSGAGMMQLASALGKSWTDNDKEEKNDTYVAADNGHHSLASQPLTHNLTMQSTDCKPLLKRGGSRRLLTTLDDVEEEPESTRSQLQNNNNDDKEKMKGDLRSTLSRASTEVPRPYGSSQTRHTQAKGRLQTISNNNNSLANLEDPENFEERFKSSQHCSEGALSKFGMCHQDQEFEEHVSSKKDTCTKAGLKSTLPFKTLLRAPLRSQSMGVMPTLTRASSRFLISTLDDVQEEPKHDSSKDFDESDDDDDDDEESDNQVKYQTSSQPHRQRHFLRSQSDLSSARFELFGGQQTLPCNSASGRQSGVDTKNMRDSVDVHRQTAYSFENHHAPNQTSSGVRHQSLPTRSASGIGRKTLMRNPSGSGISELACWREEHFLPLSLGKAAVSTNDVDSDRRQMKAAIGLSETSNVDKIEGDSDLTRSFLPESKVNYNNEPAKSIVSETPRIVSGETSNVKERNNEGHLHSLSEPSTVSHAVEDSDDDESTIHDDESTIHDDGDSDAHFVDDDDDYDDD